jgi:shikimate kinase
MPALENCRPVFLVGARGTGKTTTARLLAARLGWSWCDADALLEERAGKTIRQVFDEEGEPCFRDRESALLAEIATRPDYVVATGGGVVVRPENRALLKHGVVVWLTAAADVLWQRLQRDATTAERRPNLAQGGLAEIEEVLAARGPLYEMCCDWRVATDGRSAVEVAELIHGWLRPAG